MKIVNDLIQKWDQEIENYTRDAKSSDSKEYVAYLMGKIESLCMVREEVRLIESDVATELFKAQTEVYKQGARRYL